ncbi:hypothetical protein V6N13_059409 [Hibiscus sabdariffa]|uniref:Uncharacterized protein n=1 Tax=Hibiscus sabdariffa TaxID=183260 RepID=A0ABR2GD58_9ROSI
MQYVNYENPIDENNWNDETGCKDYGGIEESGVEYYIYELKGYGGIIDGGIIGGSIVSYVSRGGLGGANDDELELEAILSVLRDNDTMPMNVFPFIGE